MDTRSAGLAVMALALLPLSNGLLLSMERRAFIAEAITSDAEVISIEQVDGLNAERGPIMYPVLQWDDAGGLLRQARSNIGAFPAPHDVGDRVAVRYNPANPNDVRIDSLFSLWFEPALYLLPGLITLLGGLLLFRYKKKPKRTTPT